MSKNLFSVLISNGYSNCFIPIDVIPISGGLCLINFIIYGMLCDYSALFKTMVSIR